LYKRASSGVATGKIPLEVQPATEKATQTALDIQSTFQDTLRSTTTGHLPHSALGLRHAETTTSVSQLEAYLQVSPVDQFPENRDIVEKSVCQVAEKGPRQRRRLLKPKR
jgi:hypothetical protein